MFMLYIHMYNIRYLSNRIYICIKNMFDIFGIMKNTSVIYCKYTLNRDKNRCKYDSLFGI